MRIILFLFLLTSSLFGQEKILVSYFAPFGGDAKNHTEDVAKKLKKLESLKAAGLEVVLCPLDGGRGIDVSFYSKRNDFKTLKSEKEKLKGTTSSFEQLQACMAKNPDIKTVYSMGEGACQVTYESTAYNSMKTGPFSEMKDHNGNLIPDLHKIEKNSISSIPIDGNNNILAYCMAKVANGDKFSSEAVVGHDPGTYVCNNLAYSMSRFIESSKKDINYEFIHVPLHASRMPYYCENKKAAELMNNVSSQKELKEANESFSKLIAENISSFVIAKNQLLKSGKIFESKTCDPEKPLKSEEVEALNKEATDIVKKLKPLQDCYNENKKSLDLKIERSIGEKSKVL